MRSPVIMLECIRMHIRSKTAFTRKLFSTNVEKSSFEYQYPSLCLLYMTFALNNRTTFLKRSEHCV